MEDFPALGNLVLGAGALGTAAFGIVEASKWIPLIGEAGYSRIDHLLGPLNHALALAYGDEYKQLLRAQYRKDRASQLDLARSLRQGIRVGLTSDNAAALADYVGLKNPEVLSAAAAALHKDGALTDAQRNALGKFELAVDARIDAALTLASDTYVGTVRGLASIVAITLALAAGALIGAKLEWALLVGIAAVPLAPIANDLVGALRAATLALKGRA